MEKNSLSNQPEATTVEVKNSIPHNLLNQFYKSHNNSAFIYDVNCNKIVYISNSIRSITGYMPSYYSNKGILFCKTLIHPTDYPKLICDIVTFLQSTAKSTEHKAPIPTKSIWCKMKHKTKAWVQTKINIVKLGNPLKNNTHRLVGYIEKSDLSKHKNNIVLPYQITCREKEVLQLIASGDSAKIIACKLNIGENTVASHRKKLKAKLKAKNTAELIKKAIHEKLV